jgi:hypothetical protein
MDKLMENDLKIQLDGDTLNKQLRARWKQGYKTGVATERERVAAFFRQIQRDYADITFDQAWAVINDTY